MHNLAVQIAQKSQELAERRRLLELAANDDTVTDEDYMAMEDAVYDSQALRKFSRIDLACESVPDATTMLKFRHLLEAHQLPKKMFDELNIRLSRQGILMCEGTIVDATIIQAPSPPRTSAMKETRKCTRPRKAASGTLG